MALTLDGAAEGWEMRAMTPTFCHIEYLLSAVTEDGDYPQTVKFAWDEYTDLKKRASELEARIVSLEAERDAFAAENDAVHRAINEMCGTDTSTIEAVQHVIQERDEALSLRDKVIEECEEAIDERDDAKLELQRIRTMLDDGTNGNNDTALDMVKRLQSHDYALQREAWYQRM